ncbi:MAG: outer membrane protein insertion porin family [Paracoccaceae bacterium]|jgi:outer membrane protein insertion porin family
MKMLGLKQNICKLALVVAMVGSTAMIGAVSAQTVTPAVVKTISLKFSQVVVRGNQRIESSTIRNLAGIQAGQVVSPGQVNSAFQKLKASGLFEDVEVTPNGSRLVIVVREFPTINRINFERNKKLKDERLAAVITSQPRHTYSPAQAEADAALIVEAYRQSGRHNAEVRPKIIRRADNRIDLVFEVFEGKVVEIQRLSFVGNRNFSDRRLRKILSTKQAGILRQLIKSDTFVADRIQFDKQVLRDFYLSRGFIDFQVLSVSSEVARERNGFFLSFRVREGQSFDFGEITASSALSEIDPDEYQNVIKIKSGKTYSPNLLETTITRMETVATKAGLNFIRINPRVTRNDETRTLDIEFVIERGPRIFVERIDIEGNVTTLDRVIRRQFDTVEGDAFNPRKIRQASNRIRALGFFATADVQTREGSSSDRIIIDVDVEEQNTGSLGFGLTYGASSGVGGTVSLSESNFLGRGQFVKIELGGGEDNLNTDLTFREPTFLDRNLGFTINVYRRTTEQQNSFYDTLNAGFSLSLGFPVSENGNLNTSINVASNQVLNVDADSSVLVIAETNTVSSVSATYLFDNRGNGLNPNAGIVLRLSQEMAGLGGSTSFSKTTALIGARTSRFNDSLVLNAELEGGLLVDFSGTSNLSDRFFLGDSIMRGYATNGIGPRDLTAVNNDALGGNFYAVARFEANFPIGLPEEYGISGGVFLDIGSLWGLDNTTGSAGTVDDGFLLRSVIGVSLFWDTAVGPLRFNFTQVLNSSPDDEAEGFSLTVGKSF